MTDDGLCLFQSEDIRSRPKTMTLRTVVLSLVESSSYKTDYGGISHEPRNARNCLIPLVGAGRFERPTPCARGGVRFLLETACFQVLTFQ
jgi:hypothetical protein